MFLSVTRFCSQKVFFLMYEDMKLILPEIQISIWQKYVERVGDGKGCQFYACEVEAAVAGGCLPQRFASSGNPRGSVIQRQFSSSLC